MAIAVEPHPQEVHSKAETIGCTHVGIECGAHVVDCGVCVVGAGGSVDGNSIDTLRPLSTSLAAASTVSLVM